MKKLALTFFLVIVMATVASAADITITFQWDKNPEPDIATYRLYESNVSGDYTKGEHVAEFAHLPEFDTQEAEYTFDAVTGATYFWVVTAVDSEGFESDWSNEVTFSVILPVAPTNVTISGVVVND